MRKCGFMQASTFTQKCQLDLQTLGSLQTLLLAGENAPLQINQGNMKNQSGKSDSRLARNLPPLLKFGRRILDFLSSLIGCFVPARKRTGRFESGVWMDHNLS